MTFRRSMKVSKRDKKDKSAQSKKAKQTPYIDIILEKTDEIYPTSTIEQAMKTFLKTRVRALPVVDPGQKILLGAVSPNDIINYYCGGEKHKIFLKNNETMQSAVNTPVSMIMNERPIACDEKTDIEKALELLKDTNTVFVTRGKKIIGKVGIETVVHALRGAEISAKVKDVMIKNPVTATPGYTVKDACEILVRNHFGELPVVQEGELAGIITYADLMKYISGPALKKTHEQATSERISVIMTMDVVTADPEEKLESAIKKMEETGYRALPVVDKTLVGIITQRDIVRKIKQ
ncbi:MAG: CBS domain-containing protein [archaeon]